jgi:hypothetical protein
MDTEMFVIYLCQMNAKKSDTFDTVLQTNTDFIIVVHFISLVRWVPIHQSMAHAWVADGGTASSCGGGCEYIE